MANFILSILFLEFYPSSAPYSLLNNSESNKKNINSNYHKKKNIFFIESNPNRSEIDLKQLCSIESVARNNPKANVCGSYNPISLGFGVGKIHWQVILNESRITKVRVQMASF